MKVSESNKVSELFIRGSLQVVTESHRTEVFLGCHSGDGVREVHVLLLGRVETTAESATCVRGQTSYNTVNSPNSGHFGARPTAIIKGMSLIEELLLHPLIEMLDRANNISSLQI